MNEISGILIEKPPSVSKSSMMIGESPSAGTQALNKRIERIDAMNPLPGDSEEMKNWINRNKENGVYIRLDARDIHRKSSEISGNDQSGVRSKAVRDNISIESSIIGKSVEWAPAQVFGDPE